MQVATSATRCALKAPVGGCSHTSVPLRNVSDQPVTVTLSVTGPKNLISGCSVSPSEVVLGADRKPAHLQLRWSPSRPCPQTRCVLKCKVLGLDTVVMQMPFWVSCEAPSLPQVLLGVLTLVTRVREN